jgi:hypothetical protein
MLNSARANTNFAYSANFASPAHFVASLRRRRLPVFLARRSLPCQFLFSSLFFVLRYRLLATSYWLCILAAFYPTPYASGTHPHPFSRPHPPMPFVKL